MTSKDARYRNATNPKLNLTPLNALPLSWAKTGKLQKNHGHEVMI